MSLVELEDLLTARKWYDSAEKIKQMIKAGQLTPSDAGRVRECLEQALVRMHPHTASDVSVALAALLPVKDAISLLESVECTISSHMPDGVLYANDLIYAQMHLCVYRTSAGDFEGRESEILGWFKVYDSDEGEIPFSQKNYTFLQYAAYVLYEGIRHFEQAQKYLLRYITESSDFALLERLVELSIISESFFNFSAVALLEGFSLLQNSALVELFVSFNHGDVGKVISLRPQIAAMLEKTGEHLQTDSRLERIVEKAYLTNILNICFAASRNVIPFNMLVSELGLSDHDYLIALLLKALGNGLISGYIDSKSKCLFFDRLVPRALADRDLSEMRNKFAVWKDRVSQVVEQIEASKFAA